MTKSLTEQWREGTLDAGEYYIMLDDGSITTDKYFPKTGFAEEIPVEVLAPVPTYKEYLGLLSDQLAKNEGEEINAELEAENKRLKEQLNEAKKALCEASRMALSDEKDISKIYDIVYPVIIKLNNSGV